MSITFPDRPTAWICKKCLKMDFPEIEESLAKPEHIPYRGVDIGTCGNPMIPVYSKEDILKANEET
jgi:hypothetical protein